MNKLIPQQITGVENQILFRGPELADYWRLIQTVESFGFSEGVFGDLNVYFDIWYGEGADYSCIQIHRMYFPDTAERIIVTDCVQDFPPTIQPRAVNFYISKGNDGKITVSPYDKAVVPHEIFNLMKKAGSFAHCDGARLSISPFMKCRKEFILKNGTWQPAFVKR